MTQRILTLLFLVSGLMLPPFAGAEGIFDNPENLKVLPKDISARELSNTMRGFSFATGLRCSNCHVGEEGQDLEEYDFASDEVETKLIARDMLRMVAAINEDHLTKLEGEKSISCMTCHRGIARPKLTQDVLAEELADNGIDGLKKKYLQLRETYYGSHSYDFTERMLLGLAEQQAFVDPTVAESLLLMNLDYFNDSFQTNFMLGRLYMMQKNTDGARTYLNRANDIMPHPMVKKALDELPNSTQTFAHSMAGSQAPALGL